MDHGIRQRVFDRMTLLGGAALDLTTLFDAATMLLARALPHDSSCWHTMDPATLVETSYRSYQMPSPSPQVAEIAYLATDYNSFPALALGSRHSGVLSDATGGRLELSQRYRELLRPNNVRGELRTAFVAGGSCWGCFSMFREAPADFTATERDYAHDLASLLGHLVRAAGVRARATGEETTRWPGVVLLDSARRVVSVTEPARTWLGELGFDGEVGVDPLPFAVLMVTERVRESGAPTSVRLLAESGRWIHLHAAPLTGEGRDRVTVILQAAPLDAVAPLISAAYGFTARERELVGLVLEGYRTSEIAARLFISPHTVQAHLKSVFAKAGVRSRSELVGRRFRGYGSSSPGLDA